VKFSFPPKTSVPVVKTWDSDVKAVFALSTAWALAEVKVPKTKLPTAKTAKSGFII
jgi:hypothetical protein